MNRTVFAVLILITQWKFCRSVEAKINSTFPQYAVNSTIILEGTIEEIANLGNTYIWIFKNVCIK